MKFKKISLIICCLFVFFGCSRKGGVEPLRFSGATMGTTWSVVLVSPEEGLHTDLSLLLQQRLEHLNALLSAYDPDSDVSRFNRYQGSDWFAVSQETAAVVTLAQSVSALTSGAFDISVGSLVDLWGFGPSERRQELPAQDLIDEYRSWTGYTKLDVRLTPAALKKTVGRLQIDLAAVAKGYAVDMLAELLRQQGVENYLVEVGGELQVAGLRADGTLWQVGLEKPLEGVREVDRVLPITGTALATSGNYRNYYVAQGQHYAHTIDPVSGRPVVHKLASATVLDQSCAKADALATALMVMGEEKGRTLVEDQGIAALFLVHDGEQLSDYMSSAFNRFVSEESK
jgi:thiamine biosynthesis lipoprotein